MESQPQNPEFRINPENFHPCCVQLFKKNSILSFEISVESALCFVPTMNPF